MKKAFIIGVMGGGKALPAQELKAYHVVVACPGGAGTLSEIALALKYGKKVILFDFDPGTGFDDYRKKGELTFVKTPEEVIEAIKTILF